LADHMINEYFNPVIVLFGSYSRGEDIEGSDIDLYVETPKKRNFDLEKFENILKRRIQVFNYKNIREVLNIHLRNNIINGITINNFLEAAS
jgi:predicted nucleotidyltransferase